MGPKLWLVLMNVPVVESNRYVKPAAGDGSGRLVNWLASATLNCVKLDWKALLKCAECVESVRQRGLAVHDEPIGPEEIVKHLRQRGHGARLRRSVRRQSQQQHQECQNTPTHGTLRSCYRAAWWRTDSMTQSAPAWRSVSVVMVSLRSC